MQIYERDVMFRQQVGNLQLIVGIYNNVQATILPVEKPLITQKLEAVDSALKKGLQVNKDRVPQCLPWVICLCIAASTDHRTAIVLPSALLMAV